MTPDGKNHPAYADGAREGDQISLRLASLEKQLNIESKVKQVMMISMLYEFATKKMTRKCSNCHGAGPPKNCLNACLTSPYK